MDNKKLEAAARQHSSKWLLREDYGKLDLKWLAEESSLCHEFIDKMKVDFAQQLLSEQTAELQKEVDRLKQELEVTDSLLNERQKVLDAIPECEAHGSCVPHAIEWIEQAVKEREEMKKYGKFYHLDSCDYIKSENRWPCSCGYDQFKTKQP